MARRVRAAAAQRLLLVVQECEVRVEKAVTGVSVVVTPCTHAAVMRANVWANFEQKKREVCAHPTLDAHRCSSTSVENEDSAPIAAWPTSMSTMLTAQSMLRVSAAASDARGVATGARRMKKRL